MTVATLLGGMAALACFVALLDFLDDVERRK